ncbi:MAG TPA: adenylate/guanylate cyclase domain-containing protein, partial [Casimicrobiaceae bacterium]|nr:adenylate/guanylate cyclase domain-containing protein [Casimicrobiaceae bacterium]
MDSRSTITTIVFTDIEGSSRLWEDEPEQMRAALAAHDTLLRSIVERHHGNVVKMTGDGICASFDDPLDAVIAAVEMQRAVADPRSTNGMALRIRCGMHVGALERRDNDYFGKAINRAARIMNAAHGGQILASQAVAELARDRLPEPISLRDLGSLRLRDLASAERIHQIDHPALRRDFPPLRSLAETPNNLPQQLMSFVGRERELAQARELFARSRLLTLCGAGGIGKSRLSLELANEVLEAFPDGVWLVELAPLTDARLVPQAIASALGVREAAGRPIADALVSHVAERDMLLILDNCEHLLDTCADFANELIRNSRGLKIMASSRE